MRWIFLLLLWLMAARPGAAELSFTKEVAPIFVAKCLACHNAEKAKGRFRLHTYESLLKPGASKEAAIVPGRPVDSKLFQLITATNEDDRMPQKDEPLSRAQIATIAQWIEQGAKFDGTNRAVPLAVLSPPEFPPAPHAYPVPLPITALAFDVSGEHLAASGYHEITIWNSHSGELIQRIGNLAERTFDLAFSPNGRWLAAASGTPGIIGEVKLFNATNGQLAQVLATIADAELCLTFSPDGKRLAAGGADNIIRLWNLETARPPLTIEQHADWILALAFSPDGSRLASASRDKSARIFDAESGELDETYMGHGDFVTAIGWPDAKSVLSMSRTKNAHRWNLKDLKKSAEFSGWEAEPTRMLISGSNVFSASLDHFVRHHNLISHSVVRTFEAHRDAVYALSLHVPTQRLASGSHDGEVRIWNTRDGKLLLNFLAAPGYTPKLSRSE